MCMIPYLNRVQTLILKPLGDAESIYDVLLPATKQDTRNRVGKNPKSNCQFMTFAS